ncbi:MAG: protein-glutamate O-methyltransferase [Pseudomonadota bacterium]
MESQAAVHSTHRGLEYRFTDADFAGVAEIARTSFGLSLEPHKRNLVYGRLSRRLRALDINTFTEYLDFLRGPSGHGERREMLSALTTNVTSFFREAHHFDLLHEMVLPDLLARAQRGKRVRLWSAGCSGGQEAFSMALTIVGACLDAPKLDIRILATDVDPVILRQGIRARYSKSELSEIPTSLRSIGTEIHEDGTFSISPKVRQLVTFGELNLMNRWPMQGPFDVIFCRNVAIYFDHPTQQKLWSSFAGLLREGGHLMIGHSERVIGPASGLFRSTGVTSYEKNKGVSDAKSCQR